jgi:DNA-binding XRE family transcriptional regulator
MPRPNLRKTEALTYRKQAKMNQAEFAKAVGCSLASIQSIEIKRMKLSQKMRLQMQMVVAQRTPEELMEMINAATNAYRDSLIAKYLPSQKQKAA